MRKIEASINDLPWTDERKEAIKKLDDEFFQLVRNSIIKTPGVAGLYTRGIIGLKEMFSAKKRYRKAITINADADHMNLGIAIKIRAGNNLREVGSQVQQTVKNELSGLLDKTIETIDVKVEAIIA